MNTKSKTITKRPGRKALGVILLSLAMLLVLLVGIVRAEDLPTIASDKPDYAPGEWVTLTGQNWFADDQVRITVNDDYGSTWNRSVIVEVANGSLSDYFQLPTWFVATYSVTATGMQSGLVATTTFTDANIGTYDQCANDDGDGYATGDTGCRWINGNLQRNNST
ncbi:MAG TPA: hypothetical protein VLA49_16920, partial [Anaerolineales bacterium]|nr:hypothetical protein [Anaerolineales bacterium]